MYSDDDSHSPWTDQNAADASATVAPGSRSQNPDVHAPATADNAAAGYATYELRRVLAKIEQARDEQALFWASNTAFGPNNFCNHFGEALSTTSQGQSFLALQKTMMLAELEDRLSGRAEWPPGGTRSLGFGGPELWEVGRHLRSVRIGLVNEHAQLKKAAQTRDALLIELNALFNQPSPTFNEVRGLIDSQAHAHWMRYLAMVTQPGGQADAGWSLGLVLSEVLTQIANLAHREEFLAGISESVPALAGYAVQLRNS